MFAKSPHNALGILFMSLSPEVKKEILRKIIEVSPIMEDNFRMYFYKKKRYNPALMDSSLKEILMSYDARFIHTFVPNNRCEIGINRLNQCRMQQTQLIAC